MKIDWAALGLVSVVALVATVVVVVITAFGVRAFDLANERVKEGRSAGGRQATGYACMAVAGAAVLYGIYLIVPAFH